jgi:two-component system, cell cycle response regulator
MIKFNDQDTKLNSGPMPFKKGDFPIGEVVPPIYLVFLGGGFPGRMIRVGPGETTIGRAEDNTIPIFDVEISRCHGRLLVDEAGQTWLEDLGSTNGTYRNGKQLSERVLVKVEDGDQLQFGSTVVFKFLRPTTSDERLLQVLFERAARDPLTGLYNRAFFLDQVIYQALQGGRVGHGLAILLLDIDHFKKINDTYGHGVGDEVLRLVANILRESVRSQDLVARFGGEEFILAVNAPGFSQARSVAEQVRLLLAARPVLASGHHVKVTASFGGDFAEPGRFQDAARMIQTADQALYQAKNNGRDRVVFEDRSTWPAWSIKGTTP